MTWSTEQTHRMLEQFWQHGIVKCQDDNGPLKLRLHTLHGGDYELRAECPVCGQRNELRRGDDPQRHRFRRWTMDEIQALDLLTQERSEPPCPVCRAPVQKH